MRAREQPRGQAQAFHGRTALIHADDAFYAAAALTEGGESSGQPAQS
jgi:hypothetical protein